MVLKERGDGGRLDVSVVMKYSSCHTSGLTVDDAVLIFSFSNPHPEEDPIVQEVSDYVQEWRIIWERLYL